MRKSLKKALSVALATTMVFSVPVAISAAPSVNNSPSANLSPDSTGSQVELMKELIGDVTIDGFASARTGSVDVVGNFDVTYRFYEKSLGEENWHNFVVELTDGTNYIDLRADNFGWASGEGNALTWGETQVNWQEFKDELKAGAECQVRLTRNCYVINAEIKAGKSTFNCKVDCPSLASNVKIYLTGEKCKISGSPIVDEQPTEKPTEQPTEKPTEEPTQKPTEKPTQKPTEEPTQKPVVKVTKVAVSKTSVTLEKGASSSVKVSVSPSTATNKKFTASSSKSSVASVSVSGSYVKIKAVKAGSAVVTVKAADGSNKYAKINVKVVVSNKKLSVSPTKLILEKGKKQTLKVTKTSGTTDSVKFSSKKSSYASVSSKGVVTAKKVGSTYVTVKCGSKSKTISVKVVNKNTKLTLKNGKDSVTSKKGVSVKKGKTVTVKATTTKNTVAVTAKAKSSKIAKVTVSGKNIKVKGLKKGSTKVTVKCGSKSVAFTVKVK